MWNNTLSKERTYNPGNKCPSGQWKTFQNNSEGHATHNRSAWHNLSQNNLWGKLKMNFLALMRRPFINISRIGDLEVAPVFSEVTGSQVRTPRSGEVQWPEKITQWVSVKVGLEPSLETFISLIHHLCFSSASDVCWDQGFRLGTIDTWCQPILSRERLSCAL